jgi:6-phosphogluconolactonase
VNGRWPATLHAGTYAARGGEGVYPISKSPGGSWVAGTAIGDAQNASYAAYSARFDLHYLADEANGTISVFRVADGWTCLGTLSSGGREPCYIALDPAETALAIANYGSGALAYYRLDPANGLPLGPPAIRQNGGHGPNADRQEGPHGHCARFSPDGRWLFYVDLGTDEILACRHDAGTGDLDDAVLAFAAPPGSGPRHLVFSANGSHAYLVSELASSVTVLTVEGARLVECQTISTLPPGFAGSSLAGHIALDAEERRLYVSNRGHDSIAAFAVAEDGKLAPILHAPSGGRSPRFFLLSADGQFVIAHEEDGAIRMGRADEEGVVLVGSAEIHVPGAAHLFYA